MIQSHLRTDAPVVVETAQQAAQATAHPSQMLPALSQLHSSQSSFPGLKLGVLGLKGEPYMLGSRVPNREHHLRECRDVRGLGFRV